MLEGIKKESLPHLSRRFAQDVKPASHQGFDVRRFRRIPLLELFQYVEQTAAQSAGAMRPNRIDRDPLEAVEEHRDRLCFSGKSAHERRGVPGAGRTRNHQIRSLLLCPLSYGDGRAKLYSKCTKENRLQRVSNRKARKDRQEGHNESSRPWRSSRFTIPIPLRRGVKFTCPCHRIPVQSRRH